MRSFPQFFDLSGLTHVDLKIYRLPPEHHDAPQRSLFVTRVKQFLMECPNLEVCPVAFFNIPNFHRQSILASFLEDLQSLLLPHLPQESIH